MIKVYHGYEKSPFDQGRSAGSWGANLYFFSQHSIGHESPAVGFWILSEIPRRDGMEHQAVPRGRIDTFIRRGSECDLQVLLEPASALCSVLENRTPCADVNVVGLPIVAVHVPESSIRIEPGDGSEEDA